MSTSIDNRIVEMKFDNEKFEKNVKTSQETLTKFKEALNLTSSAENFNKNISSAINNVDFSSMADSLEFLANRFSNLGIIGITVLQDIANTAINAAKNMVSYVTNAVIQGGRARAQNIENAKFQLKGMDVEWKNIQADILHGVDATAYGLDSAAMAASQLVASGVEFGEKFGATGNSPMAKALRGISGLAAMTNSSYDDISRVFTTVAGNGRLMGEQLLQISSRGINAAAALVDAFNGVNGIGEDSEKFLKGISESTQQQIRTLTGGLAITEEQLRDFVSKGKINFAMFSESMDAAFGEHAKKANDTLQGVLANIRSALAKIGADFWQPIIRNEGTFVKMLESLRLRINDVKTAIRDMLGWAEDSDHIEYLMKWKNLTDDIFNSIKEKLDTLDINKLTKAVQTIVTSVINFGSSIVNIFRVIGTLVKPIIDTFKVIFNVDGVQTFLDKINELSLRFKKITDTLKPSEELIKNIYDIAKAIFSVANIGLQIFKGLFGVLKSIFSASIPAGNGIIGIVAKFSVLITKISDFVNKTQIIQKAFSFIRTIASSAVGIVSKFFTAIKEGFLSTEEKSKKATTGLSVFRDILSKVGNIAKWFTDNVMSKLTNVGEKVGSIFAKLSDVFGSLFTKIVDFSKGILPSIGSAIKGILGILERVLEIIVKTVNSLDVSKGFDIINGGIFTYILLQLKDFVSGAQDLAGKVGDILGVLKNGLQGLFGDDEEDSKANIDNIQKFAIAIGILAASLAVLASIDADKLIFAFGAIEGLILALESVFSTISAIPPSKGIKGAITGFLDAFSLSSKMTGLIKFAAAVFVLAEALKVLGGLNAEQLAKGLAGITAIMLDLVMVSTMLEKNETQMVKGSVGLIAFAAAIVILGKAVENLGSLSWEELAKGLLGFANILAVLLGFAITLNKTNSTETFKKLGASLIPLAAAVLILTQSVKQLADLSWEELAKGLLGFANILAVLLGFAITLNKTNSTETFKRLGISLIPFAAAVLILTQSVKQLADLSWEELAKGLLGFANIMAVLLGFAITLEKTNTTSAFAKLGISLIPFATGILIMSSAIKKLGALSLEQIAKGLGSILVLLGSIATLAIVMKTTESSLAGTAASLLVFAAALAFLVPELKALGNMSWTNIAKAMVALAGALAILGGAAVILGGSAKSIALAGAALAAFGAGLALAGIGIVSIAAGLTAIGTSLNVVGKGLSTFIKELIHLIPDIVNAFGEFIESIANVIGKAIPSIVKAFAAIIDGICQAILEAVPTILATIVQLLDALIVNIPQIVDKVVLMIIKILDALSNRMPELVKAIAKFIKSFIDAVMDLFKDVSLAELVSAIKDMSVVALVLAVIGNTGLAALKGLGIMTLIIAGLGLIVVGLGALVNAIPELEELLTKGIPILGKIGYAIGDFVGNLVGGLMAGLSNGLPQIADNLSLFMTKLQPFIDGARQVDQGVAKSALYLAETILVLTGTSLLEGIASFITGKADFGKLGEQLVPFGEAMGKFADSVKGIDTDVVESAANAGKAIAQMAKALPNEGGFLAKLVGDNNMGLIGPQLEGFGQALKAFSDSITANGGIDSEAVTSSANAGKAIAQMAKALPNEGGFLAKLVGDNNMDKIGPQLAKFGGSLKKFADSIAGMDTEAATNAATAGKAIAEMADALPNEGGLVEKFTGSNDMDLVGPKLEAFGKHIKGYSDNVDGFKIGPVIRSVTGGKAIAELADALPNSGGAISWFAGNNDIDTFGEKMATFGTHLVAYSNAVADLNTTHLQDSVLAGQALADIAETVDGVNFTGLATFSTFGGNLEDFGKAISGYANSVKDMTVGWNLYWSVQTAQALADVAQTLQGSNVTNVFSSSNNFKDFGTQLTVFGEALVNYSNSVANADYTSIAISSIELSKLIDMLNKIQGFDFTLASNFKMALETIASTGIKGFTNVFANATEEVKTASADVKNAVLDGFGNIDHQIYKKGEDASRSFKNGFDNIDPSVSVKALVDAVVEIFNIEKETAQQASNAITAFLLKFEENRNRAQNVCKLFAERTIEGIKQANFYGAGEDAVLGYIGGLSSKNSRVYLAGYELGRLSLVAAREAVDSQSPSKEFIKLGEYDGEGLAIGMDNSGNLVESSAEKMSKTALQAVAKSISKMHEIIDDDLEIQPVITPVLDSSQIQNGINSINGMTTSNAFIGSTGFNIARGLSYSPSNGTSSPYNDSNIVAAINGLETRLDNVASRIESMRIVLDNGALVGEMAPGMNVELGNMSTLTRRGVM